MSFDAEFLSQIQADIRRKVCAGRGRPEFRKIAAAADTSTPLTLSRALVPSAYDSPATRGRK